MDDCCYKVKCTVPQIVKRPLTIRYAWADNALFANLVNETGLPAFPFSIQLP